MSAQPAGWERIEMQQYAFGAGTVPAGVMHERRRTARAPTTESDVKVPLAQSGITGLVAFLASTAIAAKSGAGWDALLSGAAWGATMWGGTWLVLLVIHRKALYEVERITGTDLDNDGYIGEPPPKSTVQVEIVEKGGRFRRYVNTPLDDDEWTKVARAVLVAGASFSRRGLKDVVPEEDYPGVYKPLLSGGLLRENGNGVELTPAGRSFLRQYLSPAGNGRH